MEANNFDWDSVESEEIPLNKIQSHPVVEKLMDKDLREQINIPYIKKNIDLMSPGTWNGYSYDSDAIEEAFEKTDWNDPQTKSLFWDHNDEQSSEWIGEVVNPKKEGDKVIGDLKIVNPNAALAIEYGAKFGISPKVDGNADTIKGKMNEFLFDNFSVVINPAVKTNWINSLNINNSDSNESAQVEHKFILNDTQKTQNEVNEMGEEKETSTNVEELEERFKKLSDKLEDIADKIENEEDIENKEDKKDDEKYPDEDKKKEKSEQAADKDKEKNPDEDKKKEEKESEENKEDYPGFTKYPYPMPENKLSAFMEFAESVKEENEDKNLEEILEDWKEKTKTPDEKVQEAKKEMSGKIDSLKDEISSLKEELEEEKEEEKEAERLSQKSTSVSEEELSEISASDADQGMMVEMLKQQGRRDLIPGGEE